MAFTNVWRTVTCDNRPSMRPVTSSAARGRRPCAVSSAPKPASGLDGESKPEDDAASFSRGRDFDRVVVIARLLFLVVPGRRRSARGA